MKNKLKIREILLFVVALQYTSCIFSQTNITYFLNTQTENHSISPLIYGTNFEIGGNNENFTCFRLGGNRMTGFNWENNASNAGNDWHQISDTFMIYSEGLSNKQKDIPGVVLTKFIDDANAVHAKSFITLPLAGYVARDKSGDSVTLKQTAPSARWCKVVPVKKFALTVNPDTSDKIVYINEEINFLTSKYGIAKNGGVAGYFLDNEPDIWATTHPRIHPNKVTCSEYADSSAVWAKAIKASDSTALVIGPASYGMNGYVTFQDAPDWNSLKPTYSWFLDYYLDKMKRASDAAGKRLLDVLDIHYYSEAIGDKRIVFSPTDKNTANDDNARVQSTRTLYDNGYIENSWIGKNMSSYLPLIPKIQKSIDTYFPGTKLAFTEYDFGGGKVISGGITLCDLFGIFAQYNVFMATLWNCDGTSPYKSSAFKLYQNYDGNNSKYGSTSITANSNNYVMSTIWASINGTSDSVIHFVVTNKSSDPITGTFKIRGKSKYKSAEVYGFNATSPTIKRMNDVQVFDSIMNYSLEPWSVYHFVVSAKEYKAVAQRNDIPYKVEIFPSFANACIQIKGIPDMYEMPVKPIHISVKAVERTTIKVLGKV